MGCKLGCNGLGGVAGGNVGAAEDEALGHRAHLAADDNDVARAELLPVLGQVRLEQPRNLRNALAVRLHDAVRPHANALQPRELSLTLFLFPPNLTECSHATKMCRKKKKKTTNSGRHHTSPSVLSPSRCTSTNHRRERESVDVTHNSVSIYGREKGHDAWRERGRGMWSCGVTV